MANAANTIKDAGTLIARMSATMLEDKMHFIKSIDKEPASSYAGIRGFSAGDTININKPTRVTVGSTADITSETGEILEEKVALAVDQRAVVNLKMTSLEIQNQLALKEWASRYLDQAISGMAQQIESDTLALAKNAVFNHVGTAGSTVFNTTTSLAARTKLAKNLTPLDDQLKMLLDSYAMASAVDARKGLFHKSDEIAKQYKMGYMGSADGFTYLESNLLPKHLNGTGDYTFTIKTTVSAQGSTAPIVQGLTATTGTLTAGTVFTVADVYAVHPITKVSTGVLQQFVVTTTATADGSGDATLAVSPAMYTTGTRKNIDRFPTASDVVTVATGAINTTYTSNLAYHPSAFRFVSVPLMMPNDAHMIGQETVNGVTVRVWQGSQILTDKMILRVDCLYGFKAVRPEWACRLIGAE